MGKWTEKEIEILKENYLTKTSDEIKKLLPNRTKGAIKTRASILQIKKGVKRSWTEAEIMILEEYLSPSCSWHWEKLLSLLPNRSQQSIQTKQRKLESELKIGWCHYCGKFYTKDSQELSNHQLQCDKNPKSKNYQKPAGYTRLKNQIFSTSLKQKIYNLFYNEGFSFSKIRYILKNKYNLKVFQQNGGQIRNLYGFPDIFLEIIEVDNWHEYEKLRLKNLSRLRYKSGFTAKLKEEIKDLFNNECAICGETNEIDNHHIDHNFRNNDKKNLIPLCQKHHSLASKGRINRKLLRKIVTSRLDKKINRKNQ